MLERRWRINLSTGEIKAYSVDSKDLTVIDSSRVDDYIKGNKLITGFKSLKEAEAALKKGQGI